MANARGSCMVVNLILSQGSLFVQGIFNDYLDCQCDVNFRELSHVIKYSKLTTTLHFSFHAFTPCFEEMKGSRLASSDGKGSPAVTKMTMVDRQIYHDFEMEEDLVFTCEYVQDMNTVKSVSSLSRCLVVESPMKIRHYSIENNEPLHFVGESARPDHLGDWKPDY